MASLSSLKSSAQLSVGSIAPWGMFRLLFVSIFWPVRCPFEELWARSCFRTVRLGLELPREFLVAAAPPLPTTSGRDELFYR